MYQIFPIPSFRAQQGDWVYEVALTKPKVKAELHSFIVAH